MYIDIWFNPNATSDTIPLLIAGKERSTWYSHSHVTAYGGAPSLAVSEYRGWNGLSVRLLLFSAERRGLDHDQSHLLLFVWLIQYHCDATAGSVTKRNRICRYKYSITVHQTESE